MKLVFTHLVGQTNQDVCWEVRVHLTAEKPFKWRQKKAFLISIFTIFIEVVRGGGGKEELMRDTNLCTPEK